MDEIEVEPVAARVTCHTEGCIAEGIAFDVLVYPNAAPPIFRAQCGPCGQTITDIVTA